MGGVVLQNDTGYHANYEPHFMIAIWQQLFTRLGTNLLFSIAYNPQTDGQSERAHKIIEQILSAYVLGCPLEQWI